MRERGLRQFLPPCEVASPCRALMNTTQYAMEIVKELGDALGQVSPQAGEDCADTILRSNRTFVAGAGRSGFAVRSFAMRLMHMGMSTYVVGETVTPNLEAGDVLLIVSASGETGSLVHMAGKAREIGASLITVTTRDSGSIAKMADVVVKIPAPTPKAASPSEASSIQPMGSLFEQCALIFLDAVILLLMEKEGKDSATMFSKHANLE